MSYWLKVAGTGSAPITNADWHAVALKWAREHGDFSGFPRRPSIKLGDRLVLYAAASGRVFGAPRFYAVEETTSWPEPGDHLRWDWAIKTRVVVPGPLLSRAPTLHQIGVKPTSVRSQSHIRLTDDQGVEAEALLQNAVERYGTPYLGADDGRSANDGPSSSAGEGSTAGRVERIDAIKSSGRRLSMPELDAALRRL